MGAYTNSGSFYGTFDQNGNVQEWIDSIVGSDRLRRGGTFSDPASKLQSGSRNTDAPDRDDINNLGFRVTTLAPIPEPSAYAAILGCLGLGLAVTRRKGRARS